MATRHYIDQELVDGAAVSLGASARWGWVILGNMTAWAVFYVNSLGTFIILSGVNVTTEDRAGWVCLFSGGIKNRTGGNLQIIGQYFKADGLTTLADDETEPLSAASFKFVEAYLSDGSFGVAKEFLAGYKEADDAPHIIPDFASLNTAGSDVDNNFCFLSTGLKNRLGGANKALEYYEHLPESGLTVPAQSVTGPGMLRLGFEGATIHGYAVVFYDDDGNLTFATNSTNVTQYSYSGHVRVYRSGAGEITIVNNTGDAGLVFYYIFNEALTFPVFESFEIKSLSDIIFEIHLNSSLRISGSGFDPDLNCTVDGEEAGVTVADSQTLDIVLPKLNPGWKNMVFYYANPLNSFTLKMAFLLTSAGYTELKALLPPDRYTDDPENLFNITLAVIAQEMDRAHYGALDLFNKEIFPELTVNLIQKHEDKYGIKPNPNDTLETRRARVLMKTVTRPSISVPYLLKIVQALLPAGQITENEDYAVFGDLVWQYQVYEPSQNYLDTQTYGELLAALIGAGPGYTRPEIGAEGFIVGESKTGRDFLTPN